MANGQPDLTAAQAVEQFKSNVALLNLFINGTSEQMVLVDAGSYPTIAKIVQDSQATLLQALSRQDVDDLLLAIGQKSGVFDTLAGYGIIDGVNTDDPRLGVTTIKQVRKNPGANQYESIFDALAAITDASTTNRYLIQVDPGNYIEPQLAMKPFVVIDGAGVGATSIEALDPNVDLIIGATDAAMRNLELTGATGTNKALVAMNDADQTLQRVFALQNVRLGAADTLVNCVSGYVTLTDCLYGGDTPFVNGFLTANNDNRNARIALRGCSSNGMATPYPSVMFRADGTNCQIILQSVMTRAKGPSTTEQQNPPPPADVGVHLRNGGYLRGMGVSFVGFNEAIWVENAGAAPTLLCEGINLSDNIMDIVVEHPGTKGNVHGAATRSKVSVPATLQNLTLLYIDLGSQGFVNVGPMYVGKTHATLANIEPLISRGLPVGLMEGGAITSGTGLNVEVEAGSGYVRIDGSLVNVKWNATTYVAPANTTAYLYADKDGVLHTSVALPDTASNVVLGRMLTGPANIVLIGNQGATDIPSFSPNLDKLLKEAIGAIYVSGSIVSANATNPMAIDISQGRYFYSTDEALPEARTAASMYCVFHSSGAPALTIWTALHNTNYDNGTDLVPLTAGHYTKHVLYTNGSGAGTTYFVSHGTGNFETLDDAITAPIPLPAIAPDGSPVVAAIIVQEGHNGIIQVMDLRPRMGFAAASTAGATRHGDLLGLDDDDHQQYLLVNGLRAMLGNLQMGGHDIEDVGLIDGVNVADHSGRHQPNGEDPIATASPSSALSPMSTNNEGVANSLARSDHEHAITGFQVQSTMLSAVAALNEAGSGFVRRAANGVWSASALVAADLPINVALPGTAGITPAAGTTAQREATPTPGRFRYNTTTGQHEGYTPDGWVPMNNVLLNYYHGEVGQVTGTTIIPNDNTTPLSTEGTQLWSQSVTPTRTDSVMSIDFCGTIDAANNNRTITVSIFRGTTFLGFAQANIATAGRPVNFSIKVEDIPGALTPVTYSCRIGADSSTTWCIGRNASFTMGGSNGLAWDIKEMLP